MSTEFFSVQPTILSLIGAVNNVCTCQCCQSMKSIILGKKPSKTHDKIIGMIKKCVRDNCECDFCENVHQANMKAVTDYEKIKTESVNNPKKEEH
jgi:hypothetical protein